MSHHIIDQVVEQGSAHGLKVIHDYVVPATLSFRSGVHSFSSGAQINSEVTASAVASGFSPTSIKVTSQSRSGLRVRRGGTRLFPCLLGGNSTSAFNRKA